MSVWAEVKRWFATPADEYQPPPRGSLNKLIRWHNAAIIGVVVVTSIAVLVRLAG